MSDAVREAVCLHTTQLWNIAGTHGHCKDCGKQFGEGAGGPPMEVGAAREATPSDPVREALIDAVIALELSCHRANINQEFDTYRTLKAAKEAATRALAQPEPAKSSTESDDQPKCLSCGEEFDPGFATQFGGDARYCTDTCRNRVEPAKPSEAPTDAARFQALQNMPPPEAQAYFWHYSSRSERAKAIDARLMRKDESTRQPHSMILYVRRSCSISG